MIGHTPRGEAAGVVVMVCYARSGGTLLNRCLGSLPNVVVLSEVNPLGGGWGVAGPRSYTSPQDQAKHWYDIDLTSEDFAEAIVELNRKCSDQGLRLIVRDWSFVNFTPYRHNGWTPPNRLLTLLALRGKCDMVAFALVRDSIDVWISRGTPEPRGFFAQYLAYVRELLKWRIPIFKFESFCSSPDTVMRRICDRAGLPYDDRYKQFASFDKVNGDVQMRGVPRRGRQGEIRVLRRRALPSRVVAVAENNPDMVAVNSLLGYPTSYYAVPRECAWARRAGAAMSRVGQRLLGAWKRTS